MDHLYLVEPSVFITNDELVITQRNYGLKGVSWFELRYKSTSPLATSIFSIKDSNALVKYSDDIIMVSLEYLSRTISRKGLTNRIKSKLITNRIEKPLTNDESIGPRDLFNCIICIDPITLRSWQIDILFVEAYLIELHAEI